MEIDVLTLFPGMFQALDYSIVKRAKEKGLVTLRLWDIRDYTEDRHRTVDDTPYGGGAGMVMKPDPVYRALQAVQASSATPGRRVILMTPQGRPFDQRVARGSQRRSASSSSAAITKASMSGYAP